MSELTGENIDRLNGLPVLQEVDSLADRLGRLKPLSPEKRAKVLHKLRLNWNFHSNAIEGNRLNYGETIALLLHGVTAKGKPLKDHLDIQGHEAAIEGMFDMIKSKRPLTQTDIRELHKTVLQKPYYADAILPSGEKTKKLIKVGEYKSEPNHVKTKTGVIHYYTEPEYVSAEMTDLLAWLNQSLSENQLHPVVLASVFHHRFVAIHPFDDGNGRLARIMMNYILMKYELPPAVIELEYRDGYYGVLAQADSGDYDPLIELIARSVLKSLQVQLDAATGEDITTLEDVDKQIALFKGGLSPAEKGKTPKNEATASQLTEESILPLLKDLGDRLRQFDDLFKQTEEYHYFQTPTLSGKGYHRIEEFIPAVIQALEAGHDIQRFSFEYRFKHFKTADRPTPITVSFAIDLTEYFYTLHADSIDPRLSFSKTYDQLFDSLERSRFIQIVVNDLMAKIESFR